MPAHKTFASRKPEINFMNFDPDPEDDRFRDRIRAYVGTTLRELFPEHFQIDAPVHNYEKHDMRRWIRALNEKELLVPHWPQQWGGANWHPNWRRILEEEFSNARCPPTDTIGTDFVGPVLCAFGSSEQKRCYLPAIRNGDHFWCQGFSEPHAGSDIMSLRTTAVRDREHFIVNGQKLWTTNAHNADMMFALLRIELPGIRKQQGLSFLLIDMRSTGVGVRPVIMIDGLHRVNEVSLQNVRVPTVNLVGEPGKGWVYARYLLTNERAVIAGLGQIKALLNNLREIARAEQKDGQALFADPLFRGQLSQLEIELQALEFMELRLLHSKADDSSVQILAPMLKLRGSELRQRVTELTLLTLGERALEFPFSSEKDVWAAASTSPFALPATVNYLFQRSATLAGGTSEIQRNLIAGVALGL